MKSFFPASVALVAAIGMSTPLHAQDEDAAELRAQIEAMRAEMERMSARLEQLEQREAATAQVAAEASQSATQANEAAQAIKPGVEVAWKGAPQFSGENGWSFKPRGRIQIDAGKVITPDSIGVEDGFGGEFRRLKLGVEGTIPGGFGYLFEADYAGNVVVPTDLYITYRDGGLTLAAGQQAHFPSMETLTSDRFTSFMERASFVSAFGFEYRVGLSAQLQSGDVLVQAGAFNDYFADLPNKAYSLDARAVFMPRLGDVQLHLGGSVHYTGVEDCPSSEHLAQLAA